ncbi:acetyltransferase [Oxalobacteraceae bacterium OM1]|nr:acetyltransferase [Oxalobacteraceae bacterium OM1]
MSAPSPSPERPAAGGTLAIIGAGGHASVVADAAKCSGRWERLVFYDDEPGASHPRGPWTIAGTIGDLLRTASRDIDVIVAIGENRRRHELLHEVSGAGFRLANVVHPDASVSCYATLGQGSVVFARAAINIAAAIGRGCIVNTGATVDHDCCLGEAVHVSPGANLAGNVIVGDGSWIGIGSCIREGIVVGRHAIVGAGAVVIRPVPDHAVVVGNPAHPIILR